MEQASYEDRNFEQISYSGKVARNREFHHCRFVNCDFSNTDFSGNKFIDCSFHACNLSMVGLNQSTWTENKLTETKAIGVRFDTCSDFLFSIQAEHCVLDYACFGQRKMPKTRFRNCSLKATDFTRAGLQGSIFDNCDLLDALFLNSDLRSVNFETAFNYSIDPEVNQLQKAIFSSEGLAGLLYKHRIIVR